MLNTLLWPFTWLVSTVMAGFHWFFSSLLGMNDANGFMWALCIIGLVVVLRLILMPLFVRQIHSQRRMQLIQPELQKIQKRYKGKKDEISRQKMQEETFALYKKHGTNPLSSCLPILAQMPFFFALFRILNSVPQIAEGKSVPGFFTQDMAIAMNNSAIFGAKLSSSFLHSDDTSAKILSIVLIIAMSVTTFTTQHQLMRKNMPASALDNPMARQQKWMLYAMPLIFAVTGVNFPLGVLIYWTASNLWTMCQQFFVIRRMPAPGSPAEKALEQRRLAKGKPVKKMQLHTATDDVEVATSGDTEAVVAGSGTRPRPSGQRVQPRSKKRKKNSNRPKGR